ncbi:MAG: hypothetical protein IJB30_01405, partial [Clostridia bacterium]|nr:hypothetical protein [Clostridia bacterium]
IKPDTYFEFDCKVIISGGEWKGTLTVDEQADLTITGGIFAQDVSKWVEDGTPYVVRNGKTYVGAAVNDAPLSTDEPTPKPEPKIIEGANGIFNGQAEGLTFKSNADFADFQAVKVDGKVVDAKNYTAKKGSTVVTLKAEYLKTLAEGKHTFAIVSKTGEAKTSFTIAGGAGKPAPKPTEKPASSGIKVEYNGGNSFSTSKGDVPTSVEIDGVPVPFTGNGSSFTVGCIDPNAKWVTVKWNSTTVTVNFTPDVNVVCTEIGIPKTGDMPFWAAIAAFFGF